MKISTVVKVSFLFILLLSIGCATTQIAMKPIYWESTNKKIGVALIDFPVPGAYKIGSQGLLDMAINKAMAGGLESHLKTVKMDQFNEIADRFVDKLIEKGFEAEKINTVVTIDPTINKVYSSNNKKYFKIDFNSILNDKKFDEVLLFSIDRIGTIRSYYGFIPTSAPKGLCEVKGMLVNVSDTEILWLADMGEEEAMVEVIGPWNESPDYPNVTSAIDKAIDKGKNYLSSKFFGTIDTSGN